MDVDEGHGVDEFGDVDGDDEDVGNAHDETEAEEEEKEVHDKVANQRSRPRVSASQGRVCASSKASSSASRAFSPQVRSRKAHCFLCLHQCPR
jgi:hypothetical protein